MVLRDRNKEKPKIRLIWVNPNELKAYPRNAKIHPPQQVKLLAKSIQTNSFINPIIIDVNNEIIAGHCRLEAAIWLGLKEIPTICADHLTPEQVMAYRLADNKLAELAEWDKSLLAIELKQISIDTPELIISTGFTTGEADILIEELNLGDNEDTPDPADNIPDMSDADPISKLGDLWLLGVHRLYCGNALEDPSYVALMGLERAQMIITDPPYNVVINGHVSGKGMVKHREFAMASGEMDEEAFTEFLQTSMFHMSRYSQDGSIHYIYMDFRHLGELLRAGSATYAEFKNLCVWVKKNGGMGSHYRSQHELVFVFKHGIAPHINNVQLGRFGRNRTNVWNYAGVNSFGKNRDAELAMHPTVKPVAMIKDAIMDSSNRGDIILDPFLGSGTTLIAAEQAGRRGYGMELDPLYVDTIIRRWQALTGKQAIHAETGELFDDRAASVQGGDHE